MPIAIVMAGALVAGAMLYSNVSLGKKNANLGATGAATTDTIIKIRPVDALDHIIGDPNAPVKIVEFSDYECPYCKTFHATMNALMQSGYGRTGKVAWVYRNFPIANLHSKASHEAEAAECAASLGGNLKFWEFANKLFEITPSNNKLDPAELQKTAEVIGLDIPKFNECLDSGRMKPLVDRDLKEALDSGGEGTPWNIVVASNGKTFSINGAEPYSRVTAVVEKALQEK